MWMSPFWIVAAFVRSVCGDMRPVPPNHALHSNPAIALWLQFTRPAGRVAELGSLGGRALKRMKTQKVWKAAAYVSFLCVASCIFVLLLLGDLGMKTGRSDAFGIAAIFLLFGGLFCVSRALRRDFE